MLGPGPGQATLLVPLDGSAFAEAALPHAVALARTFGGTILLLRAISLPAAAYPITVAAAMEKALEEARNEAEAYLAAVADCLRQDGLSVQTIVGEGWPADVILGRGATLGPRLIIMATHGRTGLERLLMGSVALEVVRRSLLPVLLVAARRPVTEPRR